MIKYTVIWDGSLALNGGYLACVPEVPYAEPAHEPFVIPPARAPRAERGTTRHVKGQPQAVPKHALSLARLAYGALREKPATVAQLQARMGWTRHTTETAVFWARRLPGVTIVRSLAKQRTPGARYPTLYTVVEPRGKGVHDDRLPDDERPVHASGNSVPRN